MVWPIRNQYTINKLSGFAGSEVLINKQISFMPDASLALGYIEAKVYKS